MDGLFEFFIILIVIPVTIYLMAKSFGELNDWEQNWREVAIQTGLIYSAGFLGAKLSGNYKDYEFRITGNTARSDEYASYPGYTKLTCRLPDHLLIIESRNIEIKKNIPLHKNTKVRGRIIEYKKEYLETDPEKLIDLINQLSRFADKVESFYNRHQTVEKDMPKNNSLERTRDAVHTG